MKRANTEYERSKLWELLVRWHVPGSVTPYFESIRRLLSDPMVYNDQDDHEMNWGLIGQTGDSLLRFGLETQEFDAAYQDQGGGEAFLGDLIGARNATLAVYWMRLCSRGLEDSYLADFAKLLNWNEPRVQYQVAEILSLRCHDPEHRPKLYGPNPITNGREIPYPDLAEYVAYWKKRFGVK